MSAHDEPGVRRVHIDTDPGLDDLLALALAFASPELSVQSLTTVAGNASIDAVTENAQRFLALAGLDVPLGRGAARPLSGPVVRAEIFHGEDGRRSIPIPALDRRKLPPAREVLRTSLADRSLDCVLALGPLTNLAELLLEDTTLLDGMDVIWMGGALGPGNATATAEFNCLADPEAAAEVAASGARLFIVGLDVTNQVQLMPDELPADAFSESELGNLLRALTEAMMDAEEPFGGQRLALLHDPSAVVAAFAPELFRWEPKLIDVVVTTGHERGRTVEIDASDAEQRRPTRWATEVRVEHVKQLFLDRVPGWHTR